MKKFLISAAIVASLAVPAVAQEADTAADPFVATQGEVGLGALAVVGGAAFLILATAALSGEDGDSSATPTPTED